jgi:hypothetical protein
MSPASTPPIRQATGTTTASERRTDHFCCVLAFVLKRETEWHYSLEVETLNPCHQTQDSENLGLDTQRHVVLFCNIVHAQRHASPGPEHHHSRLKPSGIVSSVVDDDLGDQLS